MANAEESDLLEVEWQFDALYLDGVAAWLRGVTVPGFTVETLDTRELHDEYHDTADWRIFRAGFTFRSRAMGERQEVTLKSLASNEDHLRRRRERTQPLEGNTPGELNDGPVGATVRVLAGNRELQRLFTVETTRRRFQLSDGDGVLGEIALDDTTLPGRTMAQRIRRVEVEVLDALVDRARPFVERLVADCGLVPAATSKFGAGLDAAGLRVPAPPDFGSTAIDAGMTAGDVALAVLRRQFADFVTNEPGTRLGDDIEALHRMRVATRRIRAASKVFAPYLPGSVQHCRAEFAWIGGALGAVRDLDVQLERLPGWRAALETPENEALGEYEAFLLRKRAIARDDMLRALDDPRYDALVDAFSTTLEAPAPRTPPIVAVAPKLLASEHRRITKLGDRITPESEAIQYHELRIATKRLRYTLEFVEPVYGKRARRVINEAVALQDLLGLHQDADVAIDALREVAGSPAAGLSGATILALGSVMEQYRRQMLELRAGFPKTYRQLTQQHWKELKARMDAAVQGSPTRRRAS